MAGVANVASTAPGLFQVQPQQFDIATRTIELISRVGFAQVAARIAPNSALDSSARTTLPLSPGPIGNIVDLNV